MNVTQYRNNVLIGNWNEDRALILARNEYQKLHPFVSPSPQRLNSDSSLFEHAMPVLISHSNTKSKLCPDFQTQALKKSSFAVAIGKDVEHRDEFNLSILPSPENEAEVYIISNENPSLRLMSSNTHIAVNEDFSLSKMPLAKFIPFEDSFSQMKRREFLWRLIRKNEPDVVCFLNCSTGRLLAMDEQFRSKAGLEVFCKNDKKHEQTYFVQREHSGKDLTPPQDICGRNNYFRIKFRES